MKRIIISGVAAIALALAGAYLGYRYFYPSYTYRYRLSVDVDTPDGMRSGSSVIEVQYEMTPNLNGSDHVSHVSGDGIFIDLGHGKNVIGLLASGPTGENVDYPAGIVFAAFGLDGNDPNMPKRLPQLKGKRQFDLTKPNFDPNGKRVLPTFVTLRDVVGPKTVEIVPPELFSEIVGSGIKLARISIEMTEDPVTRSIEQGLPWLPHPAYLNGSNVCGPGDRTHCLHGGHFMRSP